MCDLTTTVSCITLLVLTTTAAPSSTPLPLDSYLDPDTVPHHSLHTSHDENHTHVSHKLEDTKAHRQGDVESVCAAISTTSPCRCDLTKVPPDLSCTLHRQPPSIIINTSTAAGLPVGTLDVSRSAVRRGDWSWLSGVSSVHTVRLQRCNLPHLPHTLLQHLPLALRVLDLSHNHLHNFTTDSVAHLPLRQLDLSYNRLTVLHLNHSSLSQLRQVKVRHNRLHNITMSGDCPPRLTFLDAGHNHLRQLPAALWECLRQVRLTHNSLSALPALSRSSELRVVDVSGNKVTQFPQDLLSSTPLLQRLVLAGNQVELSQHLSGRVELKKLTTLDLSENRVHQLPPGLFSAAPSLTSLDLSHNQVFQLSVTTLPSLSAPLLSLNLSHNALRYVHAEAFHHLHSLRQLDLSHNPLLGQSGLGHVRFPEHVVTLDLSRCSLREVDFCQMSHLHDLNHLDLGHNHLACTCRLAQLYSTYGKQQGESSPWQCVSNQTGAVVSVARQPGCPQPVLCPSTQHHGGRAVSDVQVTVSVVLVEHHLITSWRLSDVWPNVQGFRVLCLHPGESEGEAAHTSPILDRALRSYALTDLEDGDYTVCVDVLQNRTQVLKRVCQAVRREGPNVLVGILAGAVFLLPCMVFVVYIILKDRAIRKKLADRGLSYHTADRHTLLVPAPDGPLQGTEGEVGSGCDFPSKDVDTFTTDSNCSGLGHISVGNTVDNTDRGSTPPTCPETVSTQTDISMQHLDALLRQLSLTHPSVAPCSGDPAVPAVDNTSSCVPSPQANPLSSSHHQVQAAAQPQAACSSPHTHSLSSRATPSSTPDFNSSTTTPVSPDVYHPSTASHAAHCPLPSSSPSSTPDFNSSTTTPVSPDVYHPSTASHAAHCPLPSSSPSSTPDFNSSTTTPVSPDVYHPSTASHAAHCPLPSSSPSSHVYMDSSTPDDATDSTALLSPPSTYNTVTDDASRSATAQPPGKGRQAQREAVNTHGHE
ncbi:uncharacterized protein [Littorina saxatilis]|uniref:Uncharacterized protein n=1 Tax=Littorina saxatilis TaxID=31220 RepID=A0AAN9BQ07_9CAEN